MRPRWIMIKRTDAAEDWAVFDTARLGYNADNKIMFANLGINEGFYAENLVDILSNGFKLRSAQSVVNASGGTYIYFAIAESAKLT
jgi:hypothetical protein